IGNLTDSGTITFTDVDLTDAHSISVTATSTTPLGTLTPSVSTDSTGTGLGGVISWNYSVPASAVEYLAAGQTKLENFTVTLNDGNGSTVDRTVSITITGTNDAPVAVADVGAVSANAALTTSSLTGVIQGAGTDTDVDNSTASLVVSGAVAGVGAVSQSAGVAVTLTGTLGHLTLAADGSFTYLADNAGSLATGTSANDVFSYTVKDPGGLISNTTTLTINVTAAHVANDVANTLEDTPVITSVLANDNFSGTTSISAVTQAAHGTVTVNGDKTITYTPVADFNGLDSYTYSVTSAGVTETATVNVTVSPVVDITADAVTTAEDTAITFNAITGVGSADNFEGSPVLTSVTQGLHGVVTFTSTGALTYTPVADFNGTDSFTYTVTSPAGVTETATVNVTVTPVADIANDVANTLEDTAVITNVLGNDSFEGTTTISAVTQGAHGTVTVNGDKTITYTSVADFNGLDSYTDSVTSGGITETATVNVTVTPVADIVTDAV
ncbi:MAG: tandem-95 repeat protein, partial [Gallionella sp.]|nr:tandem-95 repeat protein [Gallionella sp.]